MAMNISIDNVCMISNYVWKANMSSEDVKRLGVPARSVSGLSIIGVGENVRESDGVLTFSPESVVVFNLGTENEALFVGIGKHGSAKSMMVSKAKTRMDVARASAIFVGGDQEFLSECNTYLKPSLTEVANILMAEIKHLRTNSYGEMKLGKNRKWVNHPENFVAITIQNRDQSLAINIKGDPEKFSYSTINVVADRLPYCRFKISDKNQLEETLDAIRSSVLWGKK